MLLYFSIHIILETQIFISYLNDRCVLSGALFILIFYSICIIKGASVIRMLREFLGKEKFMDGITSYLQQYKYGNAVTADLWSALSKVRIHGRHYILPPAVQVWQCCHRRFMECFIKGMVIISILQSNQIFMKFL